MFSSCFDDVILLCSRCIKYLEWEMTVNLVEYVDAYWPEKTNKTPLLCWWYLDSNKNALLCKNNFSLFFSPFLFCFVVVLIKYTVAVYFQLNCLITTINVYVINKLYNVSTDSLSSNESHINHTSVNQSVSESVSLPFLSSVRIENSED